ncbi:hypothetical protein Hbl1158_10175 [Halobaculum sp. CBA1158]|uniref:hypothetical protein n=1 Tax=Halobaculum sp. CBA1158 TaxID=2904243 RepID=UPI001F352D77|nr:hypothetical protein [Halobaculum sp. CBA1158]UIO98900.1 hypothetical protein Hbl1158_10175 [Halobaculum sp. CBA1158]
MGVEQQERETAILMHHVAPPHELLLVDAITYLDNRDTVMTEEALANGVTAPTN